MAGTPRTKARIAALERALRDAGIDPAMIEARPDDGAPSVLALVPPNPARSEAAERDGDQRTTSDPNSDDSAHGDQSAASGARARCYADFRAETLAIASQCTARLRNFPGDRDTAQTLNIVLRTLKTIESEQKEVQPRPDDVRKGVVDMLRMLPDLCAHDAELRTLAVDALAHVVEQAEGAL